MGALRSRLPTGPLAALLGAWLLAYTGSWAFTIAVAVYAFDRSGAGAVAAVTAARLLPAVLAAPVTGRLVDRGERGRVVAWACLVQAACVGVVATLVFARSSLVLIVVLSAIGSAAATALRPALQASMPALAGTPEELTRATAWWSVIDNGGFLLGAGAGGAAIALVGAGSVVGAAAVLMAMAGAVAVTLPSVSATSADEPADDAEGLSSLLAGLRAVASSPTLRGPFAIFAGLLLLEGTTDVQLVELSLGKLHLGNAGPGVLTAVWGAGGLLGSALILPLVRRRGYGLALAAGSIVFAGGLALAAINAIPIAIGAMIPAGIGFALVEIAVMALVPRLADDAIVGRVYALSEVLYAGAAGVGALIAPSLISTLGVDGSLAAVGIAFGAGAIVAQRTFARLDYGQEEAGRVRELLRGVSFLAPLPLPRLERLVRAARPVTVPAGATVIRAGESGQEFFVVADGTVEIVEYGRRQGPGSGFGEIALIRDVPRTATVRAATDVSLLALTRAVFIGAVSGHGDATQLADAMVAEHLARPRVADPTGETAAMRAPDEDVLL
jgi:MFS family permease